MGRGLRGGRPSTFLVVFAATAATSLAHDASADHPSPACVSAFSAGPSRVREGHLIEGRIELRRCAAAACPAAMSALCAEDLRRLEPRIPSVVFAATDERGQDLYDVRVSENGTVLSDTIDGRALELDPGPHRFRFEHTDAQSASVRAISVAIVVREGDKSRAVYGRFPSDTATAPVEHQTRPIQWPVYLSAGLTVAAAGAYAGFGIDGLEERSTLESCKGHCSAGEVDTAWNHLRIADGFLAATIVGAAVTVVLFVTRPKVPNATVGVGSGGALFLGRF